MNVVDRREASSSVEVEDIHLSTLFFEERKDLPYFEREAG